MTDQNKSNDSTDQRSSEDRRTFLANAGKAAVAAVAAPAVALLLAASATKSHAVSGPLTF